MKLLQSNWVANLALWAILLVPLWYVPALSNAYGFSKGLLFFIATAVLLAAALFTLRWERVRWIFRQPIFWLVSVWLVILILATIFGVNPLRSLWGTDSRLGGLWTAIHMFVVAFILLTHLTRQLAMKLLAVVSWMGGLVALHAILQFFEINIIVSNASSRPIGLLGNPIFLGSFLVMTVFIASYLAIVSRSLSGRILYGGLALSQIIAVLLALARGPVIGLLAGLTVMSIGLLVIHRDKWTRLRPAHWALIGGGLVILLIGVYLLREPLGIGRLFNYSLTPGTSTYSRLIIAKSVIQSAAKRPWLGYGPENIYVAFDESYTPVQLETQFSDRAHSIIFDQLAAAGIAGLTVMLVFFGGLFVLVWRWWRRVRRGEQVLALAFLATLVGYLVQDLVEFDMIANYVYGAILLALLIYLATSSSDVNQLPPARRPVRSNWWLGLAATGLAGYLIWGIYLPSWRGSVLANVAFAQANLGNYDQADNLYYDAWRIRSPYRQWYFSQNYGAFVYGYVENAKSVFSSKSRVLETGLGRFKQLIEQEPLNLQLRWIYAGLQSVLDDITGQGDEGNQLFAKLVEQHANRSSFYYQWGKSLYLSRRPEEARDKLAKAVELGGMEGEADIWLGIAEAQLGNVNAALAAFHQATQGAIGETLQLTRLSFIISYLVNHNQLQDALFFQKILTKNHPYERQYWINLALLYHDTGEIELARDTALQILRRFPDTRADTLNFINSL